MPTFTQGTVKCSGCKWLCYAGGDFGMNKEYYCCHQKQKYKNIQTFFLNKEDCPLLETNNEKTI